MKIRVFVLILLGVAFFGGFYIRKKENPPLSLSDHPAYLEFCKQAARNPEAFKNFKRHPIYSVFNESFSYEEGMEMLEILKGSFPEVLTEALIEKVRVVDRLGAPYVYGYGPYGPFSPEALFHLKVAADLKAHFGELEGMRVVEIGGCSGSLCKVLHEVLDIQQYSVVSLEEMGELARVNLELMGLNEVEFVTPQELNSLESDLLVSVYSFTETSENQQKEYFKKVLPGAKRGYLVCNFLPKHYGIHALSKEKLLKWVKKIHPQVQIYPEQPKTGHNNCVLVWDTSFF